MNSLKNSIFVTLLAWSICSSIEIKAWFFDFDEFDQEIERSMNHMRESMRQMNQGLKKAYSKRPTAKKISLESNDSALTITIPHITSDDLEAQLNEDNKTLTVTTPDSHIIIGVNKNMIGIEQHQHHRSESKNGDHSAIAYGSAVSRINQTVDHTLLLDQQSIEYDQDTQQLKVIIPYKQEQKSHPIAIKKVHSKKKN